MMAAKPLMPICQEFFKKNVPLAIWFYLGNCCKIYTHKNAPASWHHQLHLHWQLHQFNPPQSLCSHCPRQHTALMWNGRVSPSQWVFLLKDWGWGRLPLKGFDPQEVFCYWKCTHRPSRHSILHCGCSTRGKAGPGTYVPRHQPRCKGLEQKKQECARI